MRSRRTQRATHHHVLLVALSLLSCTQADDATAPGEEGIASQAATATAASSHLAAGNGHTCAVAGGGIQCWGANSAGQLGAQSTLPLSFARLPVSGIASNQLAIAAGGSNTCALIAGAAWCWGANLLGQLGNAPAGSSAALPNSNVPVAVTSLSTNVTAIATGLAHSCAVVSGAVRCWGDNGFGQIGTGAASSTPARSPASVTALPGAAQDVATGGSHSCAIVNGAVWCWGYNGTGALGNATAQNPQPPDSALPVAATNLVSGATSIATGTLHTCAVIVGGVQCWGSNDAGQLGSPSASPVRAPAAVPGLTSGVLTVVAGERHTCALLASGAVMCWGDNSVGQLGTGLGSTSTPTAVTGLPTGILALTAGANHTCAATHGQMVCWGSNGSGQLAFDPNAGSQSELPAPIAGLVLGGCADGSDEQVFGGGMTGCAGAVTYANRTSLCASGYQAATALQWTSNRAVAAPSHNYWTDDPLRWSGDDTNACTVSLSIGASCGAEPMRVCTASGTDAEGNQCNWQHCGLYTNAPDNYFGGCIGNPNAGTLCIPTGSPANACTSVKSCAKWENGIVRSPSSGATLEPTTVYGTGSIHGFQICSPLCNAADATYTGGPIYAASPAACQASAAARDTQLKTTVGNLVAAEANFDSPGALMQRKAEATATVGATATGQVLQRFNESAVKLGPNTYAYNWDERWMCQNAVVTAAPQIAPNDACGCNTP